MIPLSTIKTFMMVDKGTTVFGGPLQVVSLLGKEYRNHILSFTNVCERCVHLLIDGETESNGSTTYQTPCP